MRSDTHDTAAVIETLKKIKAAELQGVYKYMHYAGLASGLNSEYIIGWFQEQSRESLDHANAANEQIRYHNRYEELHLTIHESSTSQDIHSMLQESQQHEESALTLYKELLSQVENKSIILEEYARQMIVEESKHIQQISRLLHK